MHGEKKNQQQNIQIQKHKRRNVGKRKILSWKMWEEAVSPNGKLNDSNLWGSWTPGKKRAWKIILIDFKGLEVYITSCHHFQSSAVISNTLGLISLSQQSTRTHKG